MKLKIFILFLLVFGAIGQTIFLNIDAKSNFLQENLDKSKNSYTSISDTELDKSPIQSSEVVVTIRQHDAEILNQTEKKAISTKLETKKTSSQVGKEKRLICQKAKEAAKQKQIRIAGSNHAKSSTIQNPTP